MHLSESGHQDWSESLYYHIAKEALEHAKDAATMSADAGEWTRKKAVATVIVFSALCLEAFINKMYFLLGKQTGQPNAQGRWREYPHREKWLTLPAKIDATALTFDLTSEPFLTFTQLITMRNKRTVHFRPQFEGSDTLEPGLVPWAEEIGNLALAERYFACVTEMVELLHRLTGGKTQNAANSIHGEYVRDVWSGITINYEVR